MDDHASNENNHAHLAKCIQCLDVYLYIFGNWIDFSELLVFIGTVMKKFRHAFVNLPQLTEEYIDGRRHYKTPEGNVYPSVTTILSRLPNESLREWQKRVGEEEANRVSKVAARRGTNLHEICERYLLNEERPMRGHMPDVQGMFRELCKHIDRIDEIYAIEAQLYCDTYQFAGRCDVIGTFDGHPAIMDFKTTKSEVDSSMDKVKKYFMQLSAYSLAFEERTGQEINLGVLLFASNETEPSCIQADLSKYKKEFISVLDNP